MFRFRFIVIFLFILNISLYADEKLVGQEIIERLDRTLSFEDGLTRANLYIKKGNHETHFWKVKIFKRGEDLLYTFEITHRKPVAKLLSIKRGNKLIYYNVLSGKFFGIEQLEKLERVLFTSFSFLDLSNLSYEANYSASEVNKESSETSNSSILKMIPLFSPSYKQLELQVDNNDYSPKKIDFTTTAGLLIKTLKLKYGKVKLRENNSSSEKSRLNKLEMTDNATGLVSTLEFIEIDKDTNPDRILYEMKTMYEK
jgi:Outer membrane lipoprotein-sorting protein